MPLPIRPAAKNWLRRRYRAARSAYIHWRNPFDVDDLVGALRHLGVREGDKLLVHSSFQEFEGFRGSAVDAVRALQRAVGSSGLLVMPTLPFAGSAVRYAAEQRVFDVRATPSRTGILSELFRRLPDVVRSLHPTHSVAAWGSGAAELVADHHLAGTPCGRGTPYYRLLDLGGKVLLAGVSVSALTFFHTIEEIIEPDMPFSPFTRETFRMRTKSVSGEMIESASMRLFDPELSRRRNIHRLLPVLRERSQWRDAQVGRLRLSLVGMRHALDAARTLAEQKVFCYEADRSPSNRKLPGAS